MVALVKPTLPGKGPQFIASQWDDTKKLGWAIGIDERGEGALWVGQGGGKYFKLRTSRYIQHNHWTMLGASFDATSLASLPEARSRFLGLVRAGQECLGSIEQRLAAGTDQPEVVEGDEVPV